MIESIITRLGKVKTIAGIECKWDGREITFSYVVVERNKRNLLISASGKNVASTNELSKIIPENIPVILVLSGHGILTRTLRADSITDDIYVLHQLLPNATVEDFCMSFSVTFSSDDTELLVSVIRKQTVEDILGEFSKLRMQVVGVIIGSRVSEELDQNFQNKKYFLNDKENLNPELNAVISSATLYFNVPKLNFSTNLSTLDKNTNELENKNIFLNSMKVFLFILFGVLIANFITFNYISNAINDKSREYSGLQAKVNEYNKLETEYGASIDFMEESGYLQKFKASFYSDRIAATIPRSVTLSEMSVFPLKQNKNTNQSDVFQFDSVEIIIKGYCRYDVEFNEWIQKLESLEYIKKVTIINFVRNNANEPGEFNLEINIM